MNRKKKLISIATAFALMASSIHAETFTDMIDKNSNTTNGQNWTDPRSGLQYVTGGSVTFKFPSNRNYPLIFDYEMPGISADCSGMSLEGGFLALIGYDKLAEELSSAGESAAYGIMLGLLMATPTIGDAFRAIRRWAHAIQLLLQNACQISSKVTNAFAGEGVKKLTNMVGINDGITGVQKFLEGGDEYVEAIEEFVGDPTSKIAGLADTAASESDKGPGKSLLGFPNTFESALILRNISGQSEKDGGVQSTLSKYWDNGGFSKINLSVQDKEVLKINKQLIAFAHIVFGTRVVTYNSIKESALLFDGGEINREVLKQFYINKPKADAKPKSITTTMVFSDLNINDLTTALINGSNSANPLTIPDFKLFYINMELDTELSKDSTGQSNSMGVAAKAGGHREEALLVIQAETNKVVKVEWEGMQKISEAAINILLTQTIPNYQGSTNGKKDSIAKFIPYHGESIRKIITNLRKLKGKSQEEKNRKIQNFVSNYSEILSVIFMKDFIENTYSKMLSDSSNGSTVAVSEENVKSLTERKDKIIKKLEEYAKTINTSVEEDDLIEKLEKDIEKQSSGL